MVKAEYMTSKIRVGVLMGGRSIEREVSFNSGRTICDHLDTTRYEVIPLFQTEFGDLYILPLHFLHRGKISDFLDRLPKEGKKICWDDLKNIIDFVYIALHGRFGEDGSVQGVLEVLGIPYLGTKVLGSALGMDKIIQKKILKSNNISVAKDVSIQVSQIQNLTLEYVLEKLKAEKIEFPCVVKPSHEGSSLGISVVHEKEQLLDAIKHASSCYHAKDQAVLIEEKLEGMEFVCVSLQRNNLDEVHSDDWYALSVTEVVPEKDSDFFDYVQKYMPGRASKITPARCTKEQQEDIMRVCIMVTKILGFSTISRIDGFLTKDGRVVIVDPNTLTGMAPATFLFHQAAEIGMSHTQLINYLIETELQEYGINETILKNMNKKTVSKENKNKIKIAVLLGGDSNEREISLESGRNICYKLSPQKYEVFPIFINENRELFKISQKLLVQNSTRDIFQLLTKDMQIMWSDLPEICEFVFLGLHGGIGENGSVQGLLQMLDMPYNGPGVFVSALCMDKYKTCQYLKSHGFDVPKEGLFDREELLENGLEKDNQLLKNYIESKFGSIKFPLILKPNDDGCSVFVKKIENQEELFKKIAEYFKISGKNKILIEECICGIELTCGVFGNEDPTPLPPSKVYASKDILSLEEKFLPGAGENLTPAPLPDVTLNFIKDVMKRAYQAVGCSGYTRIDCFYQPANLSPTEKDRVVILEFNTLPALTPATCLFHQAAEIGLKPMEFIDKIVEFGFENHKQKQLIKHSVQNKIVEPIVKAAPLTKEKENNLDLLNLNIS